MAPSVDVINPATQSSPVDQASAKLAALRLAQTQPKGDPQVQPLKLSGALDQFEHAEVTPVIGREYPNVQLKDLIKSPNADALLRDLAITISRRGVVFFRNQDISPEEQKELTHRLGVLAGKPESSTLHIHPIVNASRDAEQRAVDELGTPNKDNEISVISSQLRTQLYSDRKRAQATREWHSDITFEPVPADYTSLKVHTLPSTGGDTLWSSGYEIYDILSPHLKAFAETLTGHFAQPIFNETAERHNFKVYSEARGSPENVGEHLSADHPFVRTNPVTGWKSIFGLGSHFDHIKELSPRESDLLKNYILELVTTHHLAQVRFKWSKNDLAIWDNRSVYHAATPDYDGLGARAGVRAVSIGERPYFDKNSWSRREELGESKLI